MELESRTPTLCLNMIVKNESKIITRLFDSVSSIIDCYCICDTGSTDNTIQIIEDYFRDKNIPGKIVHEPFVNFCHNRNFAIKSCMGMSDFILLLDADMILKVGSFTKDLLNKADNFEILQGNESFYYKNLRIIRNSDKYSYIGVTHEYLNTPQGSRYCLIDKSTLFINDIGDGGSKSNKFERDIQLLTDGIKEEPGNARYHFYLANSYHDSGRFEEAINMYKKRIEFGGWKEEVWYSYYKIGLCYKKMNKMADAIWYWFEGYNFHPERLEGLFEILHFYRNNSKNKLALVIYNMCKEILDKNYNRDNYLFLSNDIYTFKIDYEYSIIAYYNGIDNIDNQLVTILNNDRYNVSTNNLLSNMKFYKRILNTKSKHTYDNSIISNIGNQDVNMVSSSSCLIKNPHSNGYFMNIRYVNYNIDEMGGYHNCEKHIITTNKYVELDCNLNALNEKWFELDYDGRIYIGVEDVRIFYNKYSSQFQYIGTGYHKANKIGIVSGEYNKDSLNLDVNELTQSFNNTGCEKNWVFIDYKDDIHIIYDWHPMRICKIDKDTHTLSVVETKNTPRIFSRARGSTCGFNYDNAGTLEIWFVNHIVSYESPRHYYHIISVFDKNMNLLRYSAPFKFEGTPIEYCLSIVVEDERVLINYSNWDRTTRIGEYDKKYIDSLLKYT